MKEIDDFYKKVRMLEDIFAFNGGISMKSKVSWANVGMIAKGKYSNTILEIHSMYDMGSSNSLRAGNFNNFTIQHEQKLFARTRDLSNNDLRTLMKNLEMLAGLIEKHDYAYNVVWYTYYKERV